MVIAVRLRRIILDSRRLGVACSRRAIATSWGGMVGVTASRQREKLWREFFSDPSQWWDCRPEKVNVRYPDFKHKKAQGALWLGDGQNPPWVVEKLAALPPGTVDLDMFSWNRRLARYVKAGDHETAIELFHEMQQKGMTLDRFTFVPVLNACASLQALEEGRQAHKQIIQCGCEADVFVGSCLVDMYAKCGTMEDAQSVFNKMLHRDVVTWTAMILGHVKCGEGRKALELFRKMQAEGVRPDSFTFVGVLNACASLVALEEGRSVHEQIVRSGFESVTFVGNSLVDMYTKCGSIEDAWRVFNKMSSRNVVSWNALLLGHVKCGQGQKALELFQQMQEEGLKPDPVTLGGVLNACASVVALKEGRDVHEQIIQRGWESDVFLMSTLVDMYAKCGSMEDASKAFKKMPSLDVVAWNTMIFGHVKCGQGQKALELFQEMENQGVQPDLRSFVGLLNACANVVALEEGRHAHRQIIEHGWDSDIIVGNSLIDMYAKCGILEDACKVFKNMASRDVITWNAMISGHVKCGEGQKALELFHQMEQEGVQPNPITLVGVLNACASVLAIEEGRSAHEQIIEHGWDSDIIVGNSLIDMYAKCGILEDACKVFKSMASRDVITWNAMISRHVKCGEGQKALELFHQMEQEGVQPNRITLVGVLNACASVPAIEEGRSAHEQIIENGWDLDVFVGSSLVDMYAKCGSMEDACRVFNKLPSHDVVSWNALLGGCAMHGHGKKVLKIFEQMCDEGVQPDDITFICLLSACSHAGLVEEGLCCYASMSTIHKISAKLEHYTCIVDLLGRAGHLQEAEDMIKAMPHNPNVAVWMALLGSCRIHGNVEMAERVAKQVLELEPENATGYVLLSNIYAAAVKDL